MCLTGLFSVLFFGGAIYNLFVGDIENAKIGFFIGLFLAFFAWLLGREESATQNFLGFLLENEEKLKNGESIEYRGVNLSLQSEVTQFYACISLIILTTKIPSRFFFRGSHKTGLIGTIYSLVTLILGWWGFPFGPIYTVQALYANVRGGDKKPISQLLTEIEREEIEKPDNEKSNVAKVKSPPENPWTS